MQSLKEIRRAKALTQDELAARSGVPQGTIAAIETQRSKGPRLKTLKKLAAALDVDMATIAAACDATNARTAV